MIKVINKKIDPEGPACNYWELKKETERGWEKEAGQEGKEEMKERMTENGRKDTLLMEDNWRNGII